MATKLKDSATAEKAALRLNEGIDVPAKQGEPVTPKEKTTTEKLFPEFVTDDGAIVNRPIRNLNQPSQPLPVPATPQPEAQGQTPVAPAPTAPAYLKAEELAGKMVKLKVDGIEQDVPASDLIKLTQLERHSNAQLMKLAQERAQFERERATMLANPPVAPKPDEKPVKRSPEVEVLEARLAAMEQSMVQERALLMPQIQEAGIKRVEQMVKNEIGTEDFRTYFEKIRDVALSEMAKPENASNPQARQYFDSDRFYFEKYKDLKLREMISKPQIQTPNPQAPVLQTQQGAPVVVNNSGQPVNVPTFESSSGVPGRTSEGQDWQTTYNSLYSAFKQDPTDNNALNLMRHKLRRE